MVGIAYTISDSNYFSNLNQPTNSYFRNPATSMNNDVLRSQKGMDGRK